MLDVHSIMTGLAKSRPVFHSEADFQYALAWQIHETMPESQIRLEFKPFPDATQRIYLDIWIPTEGIAIELKYPTGKLDIVHNGERYFLAGHEADDMGRYDFLKDVQRLEDVLARHEPARVAYAILLTNVSRFWRKNPRNRSTNDEDFRLHEGRKTTGQLAWSGRAGEGTTKSREQAINLKGAYDLLWQDYSTPGTASNGKFRYLAISVSPPG